MDEVRFTIFTATYNRAYLLPRVYDSILSQTFKDFEWVVIDDGSTDDTEQLINTFIQEGRIKKIIYIKKKNGGKHTAWREGTKVFNGKYVLSIDSDDILLPNALNIFDKYWCELEESDMYEQFWEVKTRGQYKDGTLVGTPLPQKVFDCNAPELTYKHKVTGDLHGCRKYSVLKNEAKVPDHFIFEEYCSNFPESIRWFRAGRKYKTRYVEEFTTCISLEAPDRLSNSNKRKAQNLSYNTLVGSIFHLNEGRNEMFKWSKLSYIKSLSILLYLSFRLKINPFRLPQKKIYCLDVFLMILLYIPVYFFFLIRESL